MTKKKEGFITNLMKMYTLVLLRESPKHGYDIMHELGRRLGKKPSAGQVYPLLRQMQKLGYVRQEAKYLGRRKRKVYRITPKGRQFSADMLKKFSDILDVAVRQKVVKCAHCGCEVYSGAHREKVGSRNMLFCCGSCAHAFLRA
jgi:DNA-binding PadR family transcriptional regulator